MREEDKNRPPPATIIPILPLFCNETAKQTQAINENGPCERQSVFQRRNLKSLIKHGEEVGAIHSLDSRIVNAGSTFAGCMHPPQAGQRFVG